MKLKTHALLFDMDGLLLDTESIHLRAYAELTRRLGNPQPAEIFKQFIGEPHLATAQWLIGELGLAGPCDKLIAQQQDIFLQMVATERPAPMPGVGEIFDRCDQCALKRGLITSSEEVQVNPIMQVMTEHLNRPGNWKNLFDVVCTGDQVKNLKPSPDLYLLAIEKLKLPASACLVLEDSPAGIIAAHAAGCRVIAVPNLYLKAEDVAQGKADFVCASLLDVLKNFDQIIN
ncbi:MAG: HAD family phosphatase [Planctomycetota bacterium]